MVPQSSSVIVTVLRHVHQTAGEVTGVGVLSAVSARPFRRRGWR
jgi:hypothetical protein